MSEQSENEQVPSESTGAPASNAAWPTPARQPDRPSAPEPVVASNNEQTTSAPPLGTPYTPSAASPSRSAGPGRALASRRCWGVGLFGAGALGGYVASGHSSSSSLTINTDNSAPGALGAAVGLKQCPASVRKVSPSVVSIDVQSSLGEDQGTGMIISSDGLVVTNNHVIAAAVGGGTITVTRTGGTKSLPATLIGADPANDVALIKINNVKRLPAIVFGNSKRLVVGDSVVAIGNALGLAAGTPTVTQGIVSALGRQVTAGDGSSSETLNNMIQTDAAINPGNSGGPLLDSAGRAIGMNTAVAGTLPDGTSAQNIGFAIPIAKVEAELPKLLKGGTISHHAAYLRCRDHDR
jgi:putative serine protease PepD